MALGMEVGLGPGHIVLDGDPAALPKKGGRAPSQTFSPFPLWPNGWMPLGMEVGLSPGDFVLDGDPDPIPKTGAEPCQFSAHVYCGQTTAWIKMPLGTEVGLSPDAIILDRDPAPPPQIGDRAPCPIFGPCPLWPNGWMNQDGTWHGGGPL